MGCYSARKKNEVTADATIWMNPCKHAPWEKVGTKDYTLYDPIYVNIQDKQIQRQKADWYLPGARSKGNEEKPLNGTSFAFGVLKLDKSCAMLLIY